jgi:tetratricopeptide (TPR) repeat protein
MLFFLLVLWGSGSSHFNLLLPYMAAGLGLILLPFLLLAMYQGVRLGLFGLVEFMCGLSYVPMGALGGLPFHRRTFHTLALIYSGVGRFQESLKYFQRQEFNKNVFDKSNSSPWNERNRLPELLDRLGRNEEAWAFAKQNVERSRRDLQDIDCPPVRENLQCDLIVAALVLSQSGHGDEAEPYLEEACTLGSSIDIGTNQFAYDQAQGQAQILALYARGLLGVQRLNYEEAIAALEQCGEAILEMRQSAKSLALKSLASESLSAKRNSELLASSQTLLGQCYLKSGQDPHQLQDKLKAVCTIVAKENSAEPPTSVDKINLNMVEVDYKISQGQSTDALVILEKTIFTLARSDAQYDQIFVDVTKKYKGLLLALDRLDDAEAIGHSLDQLISQKPAPRQSNTPLLLPTDKVRLPDLAATKKIVNRSVILFLGVLGYVITMAIFDNSKFQLGIEMWLLFLGLALIFCGRTVIDQIQLRKANFYAAQAIEQGQAIEVVLKPEGQVLPGMSLKNCRIEEGPADLQDRMFEIGISANLIYASQASDALVNRKIKARVYQSEKTGKVLAIETLGRVLTVKKEHTRKAAKTV